MNLALTQLIRSVPRAPWAPSVSSAEPGEASTTIMKPLEFYLTLCYASISFDLGSQVRRVYCHSYSISWSRLKQLNSALEGENKCAGGEEFEGPAYCLSQKVHRVNNSNSASG